ncbi:MAG: ParA family protein [Azonexus sp.]|nr:ParA family protein [Azonexus sp.]
MKAFLIANPKGGAGKSTLAVNLAGYFARQGHSVMLGDTDRQQSSREWLALRPANLPPIETWDIGPDRIARPPKGVGRIVLDTPAGLSGKLLDKVLKLSARVIVPVQPSLFDRLAARQFLRLLLAEKAVRKGKADVAVIGMRVDARTRAAAELERFFASLELPVLTCLRDTQLYGQTIAAGMTLFDLPPARAERDMAEWRPIIAWAEAD